MSFSTLRDVAYLNSRYVDYPFFRYDIFVKGPATAPAVCVVRVIDGLDKDGKQVVKVGRILEFFFPENSEGIGEGKTLLKQVVSYFGQQNCDYADFYCTNDSYIKFFLENAFKQDSEGTLPSLLDPVDGSRKYQNFEIFVSKKLAETYPEAKSTFYITRADGDQDRPNKSYRGKIK
jgi:hypothetical protein